MLNWGCGDYTTSVQWVQDRSKVNQSPGITTPWSDSTQNSSVNGYSAAPGHISHRSEEGRTEMWPLRAAGLVNGLWRCDERLLWHLFALGPSCLGQCVYAGVGSRSSCSFVLAGSSLVVALIFFGRFCFPRRSAGQRSLAKVVSITLFTDGSSALAPTAVASRSPEL